MDISREWSSWKEFPNPNALGYLNAPFGHGVYELRNRVTKERVLFGRGKNVAYRMTSLLPTPLGAGNRKNVSKSGYVFNNLNDIVYRTKACVNEDQTKKEEEAISQKYNYLFST